MENRMKNNWKEVKLDEIAEATQNSFNPRNEENQQYIGLEHVEQQTLRIIGIGDSSDTTSSKKIFSQGDILFGRLRPYFRKVVRPKFNGVCSSEFIVIKSKQGYDQGFLYYSIADSNFVDRVTKTCGGVDRPRAQWSVMKEIQTKVPINMTEQKKISTILSNYDNLIENNTKRIQLLERMAKLIYDEWFVKFKFPGHENVKMVDSELGKIPEGWEVEKLSEFVKTQYGFTETASEKEIGPKFLRGMDINKTSFINWDTVPYCKISDDNLKKYKLHKGDIVVIRMADPGKVGVVEQEVNAVFASYLIRLEILSNIKPYYLFYFLLSEQYQDYISGASTGTTRKSASAGVVTGTNIIVPDEKIMNLFEEKISMIRRNLTNLIKKNQNLLKTRDLLLPKLISGVVDVSGLDVKIPEVEA